MTPTTTPASPGLADGQELSPWLVARLPLDDMPPDLWLSLTRSGRIERALDPMYAPGLDECLAAAEKWLSRNPQFKTTARNRAIPGARPTLEKLLGSGVCERAKLQSEMVLGMLRQIPEIVNVRESLLGGRILIPKEAADLILSDAAALLERLDFTCRGIPIVGHTADLCAADGGKTGLLMADGFLRIEWPGQKLDLPLEEHWMRRASLHDPTLAYPAPDLTARSRIVLHRSVLEEIGAAARAVAHRVLWEEHEATWFILTDKPLYDLPLHGRIHARRATGVTLGRITLEIDPWLPASRVSEVYKAIQREEFKTGRKSSGTRKLQLYRFATALRAADPNCLAGEVDRKQWNQEQKQKKRRKLQYSSLKLFRRDINRALAWVDREMISPRYGLLAKAEARFKPNPRARRRHGTKTPE